MSSVSEAVERLARKKASGRQGQQDASIAALAGRVSAIEDVAQSAVEHGSQSDCKTASSQLLSVGLDLLRQGASVGSAEALRRAITGVYGWVDHQSLQDAHTKLLSVLAGDPTHPQGKETRARAAAAAFTALLAVPHAVVEAGLQPTIGGQILDSLSSAVGSIEKLPDTRSKVAALDALEAALKGAVSDTGLAPIGATFKPLVKHVDKGLADRDPAVRCAALRCAEAAAPCCAAATSTKDATSLLLGPALRAMQEDRSPEVRRAGGEAVARLLQVSLEQSLSPADAQGDSVDFVSKIRHALEVLQKAFVEAKDAASRESAAAAASLLVQKCSRTWKVPSITGFVAEMLMNFLSSVAAGPGDKWALPLKKGSAEREASHSARCISDALCSWCATIRSQRAKVHVAKKLLAQLQVDSAKLSPFALCALHSLPRIFLQMSPDGLTGLDTMSVLPNLLQCGAHCTSTSIRVDIAMAVKTLAEIRPSEVGVICHYLVSILIDNAGNAYCGMGTACDHMAARFMLTAGAALVAVLPSDAVVQPSVRPHLTELCRVARAEATSSAPQADSEPGVEPVPPQVTQELSFLLDTCLACCEGFSGLHDSLPRLSQKIASVLHAEKGISFPRSAGDAAATLASTGPALLSLVSVLRFARSSGRDTSLLITSLGPDLLTSLEDTLALLDSPNLPSRDDHIHTLLSKCRALAYEAVILLPPQLPRSAEVYKLAAKTAGTTLCSQKAGPASIATRLLREAGALPQQVVCREAWSAPREVEKEAAGVGHPFFGEWHRGLPAAAELLPEAGESSGVFLCRPAELSDAAAVCLAAAFVQQGKCARRVIAEGLAKEADRGKEGGTAQLNAATGFLCAMHLASGSSACREVDWARDADLHSVVQAVCESCRPLLASPCPVTRAAAAEAIGLATSFQGPVDSGVATIDKILPSAVGAAGPAEATGIAHCIGALHAHNPAGRGDVLSLSLSFLRRLAHADTSAPRGGKPEEDGFPQVRPAALAALARTVRASRGGAAPHLDDILGFAAEHLVTPAPAALACPFLGYDAQCSAEAASVVEAVLHSPDILEFGTPAAAAARVVLLHGLDAADPSVRAAALRAVAVLVSQGMADGLRIGTQALLTQVVREVNDLDSPATLRRVAGSDPAKAPLCSALCQVLLEVCRSDPHGAAETLGPQQLYHLLHIVAARGDPTAAQAVRGTATCLLDDCVSLLRGGAKERELGGLRSLEWLETAEKVFKECDENADILEDHRMGTKEVSAEMMCRLLIAMELTSDVSGIRGKLASAMELALRAAEESHPMPLQCAGLQAVAALIDLYRISGAAGQGGGGEVLSRDTITRIGDRARRALEPARDELVRHAAAKLAATLINSSLLTTGGVSFMLDILVSRFNEVPGEGMASLGVVSAVAQVVDTARQRHEALVGSMSEAALAELVASGQSRSHIVLQRVTAGFAEDAEEGALGGEDLKRYALAHLRSLCVMSGLAAGWVQERGKQPSLPAATAKSLLPHCQESCGTLIRAVCSDPESVGFVAGACGVVLSGMGGAPTQAVLSDVEAGLLRALDAGHDFSPYAASLAAALHDRGQELAGSPRGCTGDRLSVQETFLTGSCLSSLLPHIEPRHPVFARALHMALRSFSLLLGASHACFAPLLPDAEPLSDIAEIRELAAAVLAKLVTLALRPCVDREVYAPFVLQALLCALAADDTPPLVAAAKAGLQRMLAEGSSAALQKGMAPPIKSLLASLLSGEVRLWGEVMQAWCAALRTGDERLAPDVQRCAEAVRAGVLAGDVGAIQGLVAGVQFVNEHMRKEQHVLRELSRLCLACGTVVTSADAPESQEDTSRIISGAKLLLSAAVMMQSACSGDAEPSEQRAYQTCVMTAATALSVAASKSPSRCRVLSTCLLKLSQTHPQPFQQVLQHMEGSPVFLSCVKSQLSAVQSPVDGALRQQPQPQRA